MRERVDQTKPSDPHQGSSACAQASQVVIQRCLRTQAEQDARVAQLPLELDKHLLR